MSAPDLARMIFENDRLRELVDRLEHEKRELQRQIEVLKQQIRDFYL
jgi:nitrogen-specific signal transduction histidine kinase